MQSRDLTLGLVFVLLLLGCGCASEEEQQVRSAQVAVAPADDSFTAAVTLCRKVGSKSGRRIGAGRDFEMSKKSYVMALLDCENIKPERPYTVHLVWIRPDGREMFRKYAEVRQRVLGPAEYRTVVTWLDAEDLHKVASDTMATNEPRFTLDSRLNISRKKMREPGDYELRVYLDRKLLLSEPFNVRASG